VTNAAPNDLFRGLRIRAKVRLLLAVIFAWALILCIAVGSIVLFVRSELQTAYSEALPRAANAELLAAQLFQIEPAIENVVFLQDPTGADKELAKAQHLLARCRLRLSAMNTADPHVAKLSADLLKQCNQTEDVLQRIEHCLSSSCENERAHAFTTFASSRDMFKQLNANAKQVREIPYKSAEKRLQACQKRITDACIYGGALSILFVFSFLLLAKAFTKAIVVPVGKLMTATEAVAAGLRVKASDTFALQRDEFGDLYRSFLAMDNSLRRRDEELAAMMNDLRESNAAFQQLAYVAAHDLQEPLRTITNYLQLLEKRLGTGLDERGTKYMKGALDGAERLKKLIAALLLFARVDSKGNPMEVSNCEKIAHDVIASLSVRIQEAGARIEVAPLPEMEVDATQFGQLLQNLLQNAIKFGGKNIVISCTEKSEENIVYVSDDGVGFDMKFADRIFGIFQRVHGDEYAGTGIGLAVCKKIVQRHGGRICVESEVGKGTKFYFSIPKQAARMSA
jgi:signal transduction histidine kinase